MSDSTYHQPVQQSLSKKSSIELITKFVQIKLQILHFDVMMFGQQPTFGIGYGDMYPWKYFTDLFLIGYFYRTMLGYNVSQVDIRSGIVCIQT